MRGERQRERQPEARREGRGNADNGGERLLNHGTKKMSIECDMYDDDDDDGNEKQQSFSQTTNLNLRLGVLKFLDAPSHLYKRVCPSVRPSVRPSVCPSVRPSVRRSVGPSGRRAVGP